MHTAEITEILERAPVVAATDSDGWDAALTSDAEVLFHLKASILDIQQELLRAAEYRKPVFVHIDLAEGIGKDRVGLRYLASCGVTGIISTRAQLIKYAKECGLLAIQRCFIMDSKGMYSIRDVLDNTHPDLIELMPGVIDKAIRLYAGCGVPVIAGGLIETKAEITAALSAGALAVSTGKRALWSL